MVGACVGQPKLPALLPVKPLCERLGNTWILTPSGVGLWLGSTAGPRTQHILLSGNICNKFCFFFLHAYCILYNGRFKFQTKREVKWKTVYEINSSRMPPGSVSLQMQRDGRSTTHNLLANHCTYCLQKLLSLNSFHLPSVAGNMAVIAKCYYHCCKSFFKVIHFAPGSFCGWHFYFYQTT